MSLLAAIWLGLVLASFFVDKSIFLHFGQNRTQIWETFFVWLTNYGLSLALVIVALFYVYKQKFHQLVLLIIALLVTVEVCFLLKLLFAMPRPYIEWGAASPINLSDYSFPSMHTAIAFVFVPLAMMSKQRILKFIAAMVIAIVIGYSRVYLGAHRLSEVLAGGFVGFYLTYFFITVESKYSFLSHFYSHLKDKLELRRQILHLIVGLILAFAVYFEIFGVRSLIAIMAFGIILSFAALKINIPFVSQSLDYFERDKDRFILPGRGVILLFLGATLVLFLFPLKIAFVAILITAVGDAVGPVAGTYLGRLPLPWNKSKHYEGLLFAIVITTLAVWYVMPFYPAFFVCSITMVMESVSMKFLGKAIDDNIVVPLTAGAALSIVSFLSF